jgi:hypothetical protein
MVEMRNADENFGRRPKGKRPLGRFRYSWLDNIKINLREIALEIMD